MDCPECGDVMVKFWELPIYACPGCGQFWESEDGIIWADWTKQGLGMLASFAPRDVDARAMTVLAAGGREALRLSACIVQCMKERGL